MKFIFQFNTLNYKVRYAMAVELSKMFPGSRFYALESSEGDSAKKYIESRSEVKFDAIIDQNSVAYNALQQEADPVLLREFEESLPEKSLWRFIAADRQWGVSFLKGVYLPVTHVHHINTQENILKVVSGNIKFYNDLLQKYKVDVFIAANGQNSMACPIIERVCMNNNVLYIMPEIVRTQNYEAITDNRQYTFPQINETCRKLIDGTLTMDLSKGEKCYDEIKAAFESTDHYSFCNISHFKSRFPFCKFLYRSAKAIILALNKWYGGKTLRKRKDVVVRPPNDLGTLFSYLAYEVRKQYRRMQLVDPKFYGVFDPAQKYVYFPLHSPNEYSTQVQGTMWINQLTIIEALAKSVPFDWKVVVKEHPGTLLWRCRPASFYKEVKSYPNVVLVPTDTPSHNIITSAQLIVTVIGTTGWEAIWRGKPVIDLEENMYEATGLSRRCTDLKELSVAMYEEVNRIKRMSAAERRRRIVCLLTSIVEHGFWIDDPLKVSGDRVCTDQEAQEMGKIIAVAVKKYMAYRHIGVQEQEAAVI